MISHHRKLSVRPQGNHVDVEDEVLHNLMSDVDVERDVDVRILKEQLLSVIEGLPEKYKQVLILRFFEEKEYDEIADILQKPMGTVATLLSRAKKGLREEFINKGYMHEYERS